MLRSGLCDYSDAYIAVRGTIVVIRLDNDAYDKKVFLEIMHRLLAAQQKLIIFIGNIEDLDNVMPFYSLIKYSKNYSKTTGSLWNCYKDEPNSALGGENNSVNYSIKNSNSIDYKTSITGKIEGNNRTNNVKIVVPLKHLSNFKRTLDIPLINCEISLTLTWSKNYVIISKATRDPDPDANPAVTAVNCMFQQLLFQLKIIMEFQSN